MPDHRPTTRPFVTFNILRDESIRERSIDLVDRSRKLLKDTVDAARNALKPSHVRSGDHE